MKAYFEVFNWLFYPRRSDKSRYRTEFCVGRRQQFAALGHTIFYSLSARQSQCFCNSKKQLEVINQTVAEHVGTSKQMGYASIWLLSLTTKRFRLI